MHKSLYTTQASHRSRVHVVMLEDDNSRKEGYKGEEIKRNENKNCIELNLFTIIVHAAGQITCLALFFHCLTFTFTSAITFVCLKLFNIDDKGLTFFI